jgi:hypothetical protein
MRGLALFRRTRSDCNDASRTAHVVVAISENL